MMRAIFGVALHLDKDTGRATCPGCGAPLIGDDITIAHGGHWLCKCCAGMEIKAQRVRDLMDLFETRRPVED